LADYEPSQLNLEHKRNNGTWGVIK